MERPSTSQNLRVLVLHKESIVATGLCSTLATQPGIDVLQGIGSETSADLFDVVVCDYETGLALSQPARSRGLGSSRDGSRVLVFTALSSERAIRQALEQGVHGYVLTDSPAEELLKGVSAVSRGQRFLTRTVSQRMADSLTRETLTSRETEVLLLLAAGQRNKSIARELQIAVGTVKAHVQAIMAKLDANSRTQAVSVAAQRGLVGFDSEIASRAATSTNRSRRQVSQVSSRSALPSSRAWE